MLDFTEEQKLVQSVVRRAATERLAPLAEEVDKNDRWAPEYMETISELRLLGMPIPPEYGGVGSDLTTQTIVMEELFKVSAAAGLMVSATWASINTILRRLTPAVAPHLERLASNQFLASYCITEPDAGSDASNIKTTARLKGDEYVLNGRKCFITNGGDAEVYVVVAATTPGAGSKGTSAFVIDASIPGLQATRFEDKMGTRGARLAEIVFEDVRVPKSHLLGCEGEGLRVAMESQNVSRLYMAAAAVGIAQSALDHACRYANERVQFGKPIAKHQLVRAMIADMAIATEAARTVTYRTAALLDARGDTARAEHDSDVRKIAAIAKCLASDAAMRVTTDAVQVFGGYGYLKNCPVERLMRDAKIFQIFAGTNQIQRLAIARELLD